MLSHAAYALKHYWPSPKPNEERIASLRCRGPYAVISHYQPNESFAVPTSKHEVNLEWGALHGTTSELSMLVLDVARERLERLGNPLASAPMKTVLHDSPFRIDVEIGTNNWHP